MQCKICKSTCIKWGKQYNGKQRYHCRGCKRTSQAQYVYKAKKAATHNEFRRFQYFGVSHRLMAEFLGISRTTLSTWILKGLTLASNDKITPGGMFEIDELKTYIGTKEKEIWVSYGWSVADRRPVGLHIGKRRKEDLNPVVKQVLNHCPTKIKTDGLATYKVLIPKTIHQVGQHMANHIERNHVNLRKNVGYLVRRTICFAKSIQMLEARIRWCFCGNSDPNFFLK